MTQRNKVVVILSEAKDLCILPLTCSASFASSAVQAFSSEGNYDRDRD